AMYSQSWSPGWSTIIFLDGSVSRVPSALTMYACARAPGAPPSRPQGDEPKRSPRWDTITSVVVASNAFSRPRPPRKRPAPPESRHSRARGMRSGKFISIDSTGMFMQFETSVSMTSIPSLSGRAPMPPAASSLAPNGRPDSGVRAAEGHQQQGAGARRRHLAGERADERAEDRVGDALDGGRPAAHRRRRVWINDRPLRQDRVDRAEAAAVVWNGGVGDRA